MSDKKDSKPEDVEAGAALLSSDHAQDENGSSTSSKDSSPKDVRSQRELRRQSSDERFSFDGSDGVQLRNNARESALLYDGGDEPDWATEGSLVTQCSGWLEGEIHNFHKYCWDIREALLTKEAWLSIWAKTKVNWRSGLTVSLVNLPLSISLAVAASGSPVAGVLTTIWAGFFAALLGGCKFNIVGPTGALSGILGQAVAEMGESILSYLAILSGLIILTVFLLRWERFVLLVPSTVMEGFTVGVAFIIALNQLNFAMGLPKLPRQEDFLGNVWENVSHIPTDAEPISVLTFFVTLGLLYGLMWKWPKIPWVIVSCILGIGLSLFFEKLAGKMGINFKYQTLETRFGNLDFSPIDPPGWNSSVMSLQFVSTAFSVAFVSILETLISAKIADGMTRTTFQQRREVFGLGIANAVCGVMGGIPATAALARTSLNIKTGATSRISALINVIGVAVLSISLLWAFKYLPLPFVASMIVLVAIRMVSWGTLIRFAKLDLFLFVRTVLIAVICIVLDPTSGIVVGLILSLLLNADHMARVHSEVVMKNKDGSAVEVIPSLDVERDVLPPHKLESQQSVSQIERHAHTEAVVYRLSGALTYINSMDHKNRLKGFLEEYSILVLSFRYLYYMDIDGLEAISEVIEQFKADEDAGRKLILISGVNRSIYPLMNTAKWFEEKKKKGEVFKTYAHALRSLPGADDANTEEEAKGKEGDGSQMGGIRYSSDNLFIMNL